MLNELYQVVEAMERQKITMPPRHPRINPMRKNNDLLIVGIADGAKPASIEFWPGSEAQHLFRVEHGSAGSSFPGFNLPTPLRRLKDAPVEKLKPAVEGLLSLAKKKHLTNAELIQGISPLFGLSAPQVFTPAQAKSFERSCGDLVTELREKFSKAGTKLENFNQLLRVVERGKPSISRFSEGLAAVLLRDGDFKKKELLLIQYILFGVLDWKQRKSDIGTPEYWNEKEEQDKRASQPIYLDLSSPDPNFKRVAHRVTSDAINDALMSSEFSAAADTDGISGIDAYSGNEMPLEDKFPSPKVAELGNLKLYSVNTKEVRALLRYGLEGSQSFPISAKLTQQMNDALLYLASEQKRSQTCMAIPSAYPGKRDLLLTYLEGEPPPTEHLAEMFGGETSAFSDADFSAIARPVLEMLNAKTAANPNLNIRLISFCSIDKGRKQISLNRRFRVPDLIRATRDWQEGARNVPTVSVSFDDKSAKRQVIRSQVVPCPLDLASAINRVWSADSKTGFTSTFQRAFSNSDAYDVFIADTPVARQKADAAMSLLVGRMGTVLAGLGAMKARDNRNTFSEEVRWQSLKTIALLGILLHQLGYKKENFMQEPIANIGRLLALADSLHLQYCKHVRRGNAPSQLIGNALFNTALEQPVFAIARLAERLAPYQAWARTFNSSDPKAGVGLVKYMLSEMSSCTASINISEFPSRMQDADKAKLLLGYLADHQKAETQADEPKIGENK